MKKPHFSIGTLIVFTVTAFTAYGRQNHPLEIGAQGNQNGTIIRSIIVNPVSPNGTASEILSDPGPNLTKVTAWTSYTFNSSTNVLMINVRVINNGTTAAGSSFLGYYLSSDNVITTGDTFLGNDGIPTLAPGSYSDETITTNLSAYPPGTWYVGFIIDYPNHVAEDNEGDNVWYFGFTITVVSPNLTAQGQPTSYNFDSSTSLLTINVRVINNGAGGADRSYLGHYLSADPMITTGDQFIGENYVPSLSPGSYSDELRSIVISLFPGTWYVGFIVDHTGLVWEADENDNADCFATPITVAPPNAPILEYPPNNATGISINPLLDWQSGGGCEAIQYWIELYDGLGTCIFSNSTDRTQQRVGPLSYNATYSWKVYAENSVGDGPYSPEWCFTTETGTGIGEDHGEIPSEFALKPPYPNPFNAMTRIAFDLPESGIVRLKINDMLGREVETLVDGPIAAGAHEVVWHAEGLTSGIYLCRLEAGGFADTKKIILQR